MITPLSVTLPWRIRGVPLSSRDLVLVDCFQSIKRGSDYFMANRLALQI